MSLTLLTERGKADNDDERLSDRVCSQRERTRTLYRLSTGTIRQTYSEGTSAHELQVKEM